MQIFIKFFSIHLKFLYKIIMLVAIIWESSNPRWNRIHHN